MECLADPQTYKACEVPHYMCLGWPTPPGFKKPLLCPEPHPNLPHLDQVRCPYGMSLYHSVFFFFFSLITGTCDCLLSCLHHWMQDAQAPSLSCLPSISQGPVPSTASVTEQLSLDAGEMNGYIAATCQCLGLCSLAHTFFGVLNS